jgi:hypothetical protein
MSAYMVGTATIDRIISFLSTGRNIEWIQRQVTADTGCDLNTLEGKNELGLAMLQLNASALNARYGDKIEQHGYLFTRSHETNIFQAYKSLRCWLYQCSEGDIPDTSLLYATMERTACNLAMQIVNRMPEYEACRWD